MKTTALTRRIEEVVTPTLDHMGYALVRVQLQGMGKHQALQLMAERNDRKAMTVDDCEAISRQVSALLDVEDVISGAYRLEVSSPGIDRPLTRIDDYERFKGFLAQIELHVPLAGEITGRKKFQGVLQGLDGDAIKLKHEKEEWLLPFGDVAKAKLVLTDELIKAGVSN
ncbi:MAG: ribosome maturation factor RimP [Bdellovibrionales bacterium]